MARLGYTGKMGYYKSVFCRVNEDGAIVRNTYTYQFSTITVVLNGPIPLVFCAVATGALVVQLSRSSERVKDSIKK